MTEKTALMINTKNLTKLTIAMGNFFIKPNEIQSIPLKYYDILKKNYGDKIESVIINQAELKRMEAEAIENIALKEKIAKLEAEKSNVIAKEEPVIVKKEKSQERLDMEAEAKVLGIKTAHLMGDETLANKILEIKTAPEQTA